MPPALVYLVFSGSGCRVLKMLVGKMSLYCAKQLLASTRQMNRPT